MIQSYSSCIRNLIDILEGRFSTMIRLSTDAEYCTSIAQQIIHEVQNSYCSHIQYSRLDIIRNTIQVNEEKQKNIGSLIVENEKQEKELKQYGKGLYKNIEQSLNGLFKQLHVTVIGLEKSFLFLCL